MCVQQTGYHITSLSTHKVVSLSLQAVWENKKIPLLLLPLCCFWTARGDGGGKLVSSMQAQQS